jgi:hypothetical protein
VSDAPFHELAVGAAMSRQGGMSAAIMATTVAGLNQCVQDLRMCRVCTVEAFRAALLCFLGSDGLCVFGGR